MQITNLEVLVDLSSLRKGVAESVLRAYGAEREYAVALNAEFDFAWFDVEASDKTKTDQGKIVAAEKSELYAELKKANHSNPSTVWARVRKYGKEEAAKLGTHGLPMPAYDIEGNLITECEQGESGTKTTRSPMLRNIEDLTSLWKFNGRQENLDPKINAAQLYIGQALQALGVDLGSIG